MNLAGFEKIAKYLALALLLAILGLEGWSNYADRVNPVDASRRSAETVEPPQVQPEVKDEQSTATSRYRKAVELDPDNAEDWNKLGLLLLETGELVEAEAAFRKVLALSEARQDKEEQADAYGDLGLVYRIQGHLDQAEAVWKKSLNLYQEMGLHDAKQVQQWLDELAQHRANQPAPSTENLR